MMDWADEIERNIAAAYAEHGAILAADGDGMISKALRKARADGMREASEFIAGGRFLHDKAPGKLFAGQICPQLISRANQIEKGE